MMSQGRLVSAISLTSVMTVLTACSLFDFGPREGEAPFTDFIGSAVQVHSKFDGKATPDTGSGFLLDSGLIVTARHVVYRGSQNTLLPWKSENFARQINVAK